jgi:hypothetical protein
VNGKSIIFINTGEMEKDKKVGIWIRVSTENQVKEDSP